MAPYDDRHAAHDMILRFMGVNFSAIVDGSAKIPSSIGGDMKPVFLETDKQSTPNEPVISKSPQQDKAMWEGMFL
jgi:carboxypeptidase D